MKLGFKLPSLKLRFWFISTTFITIKVGPETISALSSLNYLGPLFGPNFKSTKTFVILTLKEKLRQLYGLLAQVKGQCHKITQGKLYNVFFCTAFLFLGPFVEFFFTISEQKKIRSLFSHFCKYLLQLPLWTCNWYILSRYGAFNISSKMDQLENGFHKHQENIVDFPLNCLA